jgi:hypothetical protein
VDDIHHDVRPGDEPLDGQRLADQRMVGAYREDEALLEQHFQLQLPIRGLARQAQVEEPGLELLEHLAGDVAVCDREAGRLAGEAREHVGHDDGQRIVGAGDAQAALGARGIEAGGPGELPDLVQHLPQGAGELLGPGRQHHLLSPPHQQGVTEMPAQPPERMAHRRLADAEPQRSPTDLALLDQHVERAQQVQIKVLQVHDRDPRR